MRVGSSIDRLGRLAASVLDTPFPFVTIVDERRSFWKSCIGVSSTELADRQNLVEESFCQYVIGSRRPLVVGDVTDDPGTRDNPSIQSMGVRPGPASRWWRRSSSTGTWR